MCLAANLQLMSGRVLASVHHSCCTAGCADDGCVVSVVGRGVVVDAVVVGALVVVVGSVVVVVVVDVVVVGVGVVVTSVMLVLNWVVGEAEDVVK